MVNTLLEAATGFNPTFLNVLTTILLPLVLGIALFLFGMNVMGEALEKSAGSKLKGILGKMTSNPLKGFSVGLAVTAVIQSSAATTVMLVGFVNSELMTLAGAIPIIMGANVGTTVTAWLLSLTGIEAGGWLSLLMPSSFTPVLALIGAILYLFIKDEKKKNIGLIMLGFSVLIFGMSAMTDAVSPLKDIPAFGELFTKFQNPLLGVLVGIIITAIMQSSSASVGILQALSITGAISFGSAIPIILGQSIGSCVTTLISSISAKREGKCVAMVHLYFNVIGALVVMILFYASYGICNLINTEIFAFINKPVDAIWIAIIHSIFKLFSTLILMPFRNQLAKLANLTVREAKADETKELFDERLIATPPIAIEHARRVTVAMADKSLAALKASFALLWNYKKESFDEIEAEESAVDVYEDEIGSYLLKISSQPLSENDSFEVTKLLHMIGDLERLSDHAVNIAESAQEMKDKGIFFSESAKAELTVMINAVSEILDNAIKSFENNSVGDAIKVEPLEEIIDTLRSEIKSRHIDRLKNNECTVELGFILTDLLTNLERVADHCSNIAGCVIEIANSSLGMHSYTESVKRGNESFDRELKVYSDKYRLI